MKNLFEMPNLIEKKYKVKYITWQGVFEKLVEGYDMQDAEDMAQTIHHGKVDVIEIIEVPMDTVLKQYARLLITEREFFGEDNGFKIQAVLHGGDLEESVVTYLNNKDEIAPFIAKAKENYNLISEVDHMSHHFEDKVYQLFQEEKNQLRYMFRLIGREVAAKHGLNSNKMILKNCNWNISPCSINSKDESNAVDELIRMGYLKTFTAERGRRFKGHKVSGTETNTFVGLTTKGWEIYNKDSQNHNY